MIRASVVIGTYGRARLLRRCLDALGRQDLPPDAYEVLVVDNNSPDETRAVVENAAAANSTVRYLHEAKQGVSYARNAGLRAARAPVVAFTDDDVVVPPNWLSSLLARLDALPPDVAGVGGEIEPVWESPRPAWLTDRYIGYLSAGVSSLPHPRFIPEDFWLIECNLAYRREALLSVGGMPEQLDRAGDNLLSGGQVVNLVLMRSGRRMFFDPAIKVKHDIPSNRVTVEWLRRRAFWEGASEYQKSVYLKQHGIDYSGPMADGLPASAEGWRQVTRPNNDEAGFDTMMNGLKALGYVAARLGLLSGR